MKMITLSVIFHELTGITDISVLKITHKILAVLFFFLNPRRCSSIFIFQTSFSIECVKEKKRRRKRGRERVILLSIKQ